MGKNTQIIIPSDNKTHSIEHRKQDANANKHMQILKFKFHFPDCLYLTFILFTSLASRGN